MYHYWAYGLTIKSELEFPELMPIEANSNADLTILLGMVPEHRIEKQNSEKRAIYVSPETYKLILPDLAEYWAENGNKIIIQLSKQVVEDTVRLFCLSNVFAAILYQRSTIPIHASAIKLESQLVLFAGQSGAGKSTLLASLLANEYPIFSDDVCVPFISAEEEVFMHSSYPMMKYWSDTIEKFKRIGKPDVQLQPDIKKYGIYFHQQFEMCAKKPVLIFFLEKSEDVTQIEIKEVKGYQLFQYLESNTYRGEYLGAIDLRQHQFGLFASLANQLRGYKVIRPAVGDSIEQITEKVIDKIKSYVKV